MIATNGETVRRYVYDVRLGERKAAALYRGDTRLWPTLSDTLAGCVLDVNELEGSEDYVYWVHALGAVARLGASAECYMKLTAGGRDYMLGSTFGAWYKAGYDGRATVDFGEDGPLWEALRVGDEVRVQLVVPEHEGVHVEAGLNGDAEAATWLPWLPGSYLRVKVGKWQKRVSAGCRFKVVGQPSGTVHVEGFAQKNGHCRGSHWGCAYARESSVLNGKVRQWCDERVPGDDSLLVRGEWYNAGSGEVFPVFPGFRKTIRFKVSAVTRHG